MADSENGGAKAKSRGKDHTSARSEAAQFLADLNKPSERVRTAKELYRYVSVSLKNEEAQFVEEFVGYLDSKDNQSVIYEYIYSDNLETRKVGIMLIVCLADTSVGGNRIVWYANFLIKKPCPTQSYPYPDPSLLCPSLDRSIRELTGPELKARILEWQREDENERATPAPVSEWTLNVTSPELVLGREITRTKELQVYMSYWNALLEANRVGAQSVAINSIQLVTEDRVDCSTVFVSDEPVMVSPNNVGQLLEDVKAEAVRLFHEERAIFEVGQTVLPSLVARYYGNTERPKIDTYIREWTDRNSNNYQ